MEFSTVESQDVKTKFCKQDSGKARLAMWTVIVILLIAPAVLARIAGIAFYRTAPPETAPDGYYWIGQEGQLGNVGSYNSPLWYAWADTNVWASGTKFFFKDGTYTNFTGTTNIVIVGGAMDGTTNNTGFFILP